jgi:hypothetical protein
MERKTHKRLTTVVRLVLRLPNEINESTMTPGPPRQTHSLYKISDFDVEVGQEARHQRIQGRQTRLPGRLRSRRTASSRLYLPAGKGLVYADIFNLPPANGPVPNPPVIGTMVFVDNIERLHLEPKRVMSIHSLNPDHLTTVAETKASRK